MYNPRTCLHSFDKSMKEWIETQLYTRAASHGITDVDPIILCGPAARRTHKLARNAGVIGRRGATYVEQYEATYNDICKQLFYEMREDNVKVLHTHTGYVEKSSRFIDMDMTGTSNNRAGIDFYHALKRQTAQFSDNKAAIFTFSIRPRGLDYTFKDLNNILKELINSTIEPVNVDYVYKPDSVKYWYTHRNAYCRQYTLKPTNNIIDTDCYYYNTGGGHMLTGIIIYK